MRHSEVFTSMSDEDRLRCRNSVAAWHLIGFMTDFEKLFRKLTRYSSIDVRVILSLFSRGATNFGLFVPASL